MGPNKNKRLFKGHIIITLGLGLLVFIELSLLEYKYQVMSGGGFLQSAALNGLPEKALFLLLYLFSVLTLYWLFSYCFISFAKRAGQEPARASFTAGILFLTVYGVAVLAFFQLHRYLADHIDMTIISEIAGGSLQSAVSYASNELGLFIAPIFVIVIIFILLYGRIQPGTGLGYSKRHIRLVLCVLFSVGFITVQSGGSYALKHNLSRAIGYGWLQSALIKVTDFDRDGSSIFSDPPDPAPFDSSIFWGAVEIPGNQIDENGLGGDLPANWGRQSISEQYSLNSAYQHLLIIVSESTRADIVGKTIDGVLVAPHITQLAQTGSFMPRAYSHAGFTATSLYTLFSGRYSYREASPSLFDEAKQQGFEISIISGQDESWGGLDQKLNTRQQTDFFYDPQEDPEKRVFPSRLPSSIKLAEEDLLVALKARLSAVDWQQRQLFYLNFQAGHFPYYHKKMTTTVIDKPLTRAQITPQNVAGLRRTYWNAMAYMDHYVGETIAALQQAGRLDETLIVFLGDHGESLFHHGTLGHGQTINSEQLQIPLVFSSSGLDFKKPVGLYDLASWLRAFINDPSRPFTKRGDCVLMYTGPFKKPGQIGQLCDADQAPLVYTVRQNQFSGSGPISEQQKLELIHRWETAVYQMDQPVN